MKVRFCTLLLLLFSLTGNSADRYTARFSPDLDSVIVSACFDGAAPRSLYRHEKAGEFTTSTQINQEETDIPSRYGRLRLPRLQPDSCVRWQVDLANAAESTQRLATRFDNGILTNGNLWFWRDDDQRDLSIEVILPDGASISAPWKQLPDSQKPTFTPDPTPAEWTSRIAIGYFPVERIQVPGTHLMLAAMGNLTQTQSGRFIDWIRESANSVSSVYGEFPHRETQILIVPIGPRSTAVPFGRVVRGGGSAIEFFVDETRTLEEYREDWTATHELSHLLLPFVSSQDRWLSEGMASYYQNILRARDGRLSEEQAWGKLNSGFERGRDATRSGQSLASATRSGWNSTMRVYWSGAAILLKADTRLRALSDGRQSLDTALSDFYHCCFETHKSWRAKELFSHLDRLTGHQVFSDLYQQHVPAESFPDVSGTYEYLGLEPTAGKVEFDHQAPGSPIRTDIMSPPQDS